MSHDIQKFMVLYIYTKAFEACFYQIAKYFRHVGSLERGLDLISSSSDRGCNIVELIRIQKLVHLTQG